MRHLFLICLLFILSIKVYSQSFDKLSRIQSTSVAAFYSHGHQQRASSMTSRVESVIAYYEKLLAFRPDVTLLVLSPTDWSTYAAIGAVYGMPHYSNARTLIVAAEDNPFWKSFVPPMAQLPASLGQQVSTVYRTGDSISMQPFFDLLAIHELAHAFHLQDSLVMQRKWMGELFANIFLHTYVAEKEPALLPALTLFPHMVVSQGTKGLKYTKLSDVHERYDEITQQYPNNYGWYQCRWHVAAAGIYDSTGSNVVKKLWVSLKENKQLLNDDQLIDFLGKKVDPLLADIVRKWDRDTTK